MDRTLTLQQPFLEDMISMLEQIDALISVGMNINFAEISRCNAFNYFLVISGMMERVKRMCHEIPNTGTPLL